MDALVLASRGEIVYRPPDDRQTEALGAVLCVVPLAVPVAPRARPAAIENLCGRFTAGFTPGLHAPVIMRPGGLFGAPHELHHLEGSVQLYSGCAQFKGCSGIAGIRALARDLFLPSADCTVHMAVCSLVLDRAVHTNQGCYLENRIAERFRSMRACIRLMDMSSLVRLHIKRFDCLEMPFELADGEDACAFPTSVDVTVSTQGALMFRIAWRRCPWDEASEARILRFCNWLGGTIRECC